MISGDNAQSEAPVKSSTHYRPDIDGLRAIAVMAVVLHHLSPGTVPGGFIGVAGPKLTATIDRLSEEGLSTIVMGAVPAYPVDVPYAVSSGTQDGAKLRYADMTSTNEYKALIGLKGFVDVASWLCPDECLVRDEEGVFYRDSNHLTIHGARSFQAHLARMLADPSHTGEQP